MKMDLTLREIRRIDQAFDRESSLTVFDQFIFRPIGVYLTFVLCRLTNVTPNQITLLSVALTGIAGILLVLDYLSIASILFLTFPILDCCDGTLSRVKKLVCKSGKIVDAIGGYAFISIFWLSISLYYQNDKNEIMGLSALVILILNLWCRLYLNKKNSTYIEEKSDNGSKNPRNSQLYYYYENMEFGSAQVPLFIFFLYVDQLYIFVLIYFILALSLLLWSLRDILWIIRSEDFGD